MSKSPRSPSRAQLAAVFFLASAPFLPALANDFVDWDDRANFVDNPHYRGFAPENLRWMLTSIHLGHYMPLTWLSSALDHALWGLDPTGYHLTNLLLHGAVAALLAGVVAQLLRRARPDAGPRAVGTAASLGALLWAVHPLRVESVAWATERRDVLSGALLLVALGAYLRWAAAGDARWRRTSLTAFALSLLSKTSGFVLPLVLLVLDAFPTGRLARGADGRRPWRERIEEKLPWLVLGALGAWLAWLGQLRARGALSTLAEVGALERALIAAQGFGFHVLKTVWPAGLAPLHPLDQVPGPLDPRAWGAAAAVLGLTALAMLLRRRRPGLLAGWLVYLIALAPVAGVVHVGVHFVAERYSYLATLPLAALAAGAILAAGARPGRRGFALAVCAALIALFGALAWRQTGVWRDSVTLWSRVAAVHPGSHVGQHRLGVALYEAGRPADAARAFERALELRPEPDDENARYDLAEALWAGGEGDGALAAVDLVLRADPVHVGALLLAEEIHVRSGEPALARARYERALAARPGFGAGRVRLSNLLRTQLDDPQGAVAEGRRAVDAGPEDDAAHAMLGLALLAAGDPAEAEGHLRFALAAAPEDDELLAALASSLERQGRGDEADLIRGRLAP